LIYGLVGLTIHPLRIALKTMKNVPPAAINPSPTAYGILRRVASEPTVKPIAIPNELASK